MNKMILALSLVVAAVSGNAFAGAKGVCPIAFEGNPNYQDQVVAKIKATTKCKVAAEIAEACALGSSMDVGIAGEAYSKCKKEVDAQLANANLACGRISAQQGTMYQSQGAFCSLKAIMAYLK